MFEVKQLARSAGLRCKHLLAHGLYLGAQALTLAWHTQDFSARCRKGLAELGVARDRAGPHQRLMLPGPGMLALVINEGCQRGDQWTRLPAWAQAHVDFV